MFLSIGIPELLVSLSVAAGVALLIIVPAARILRRIGHPQWIAIAAVIPLLNIVLLWHVAYSAWPAVERNP
jgi:hypothetical protein